MVDRLVFASGSVFTTGSCLYSYRPITEGLDNRIFVKISIDGQLFEAVLDTAATFPVCAPDIARLLDLEPASAIKSTTLHTRNGEINGHLYRLDIHFLADEGDDLVIDATCFVPEMSTEQGWTLPSFIGLNGCLERMRFAVDPNIDTLYFGPT